jgi:hypothetical protein
MQAMRRDHLAQELSRTKQVLLADYFFQPRGPHPVGQRLVQRGSGLEQLSAGRWSPACH